MSESKPERTLPLTEDADLCENMRCRMCGDNVMFESFFGEGFFRYSVVCSNPYCAVRSVRTLNKADAVTYALAENMIRPVAEEKR